MTCIAHNYKSFLFDLDGVIYLGDSVIPGTKETIEYLRTLNKNIRFLTSLSIGVLPIGAEIIPVYLNWIIPA